MVVQQRFLVVLRLLVAVGAAFVGCDGPAVGNSPPTVVITSAPEHVVPVDSVTFGWTGQDVDGNLAGFCYGLDDSTPDTWTGDSAVVLRGVAFGSHEFYVRAEDDSGARSAAAVRSFRVEYDSAVARRGSDTTLEIATWNIQNFPKQGDETINKLRAMMVRLDIDLYAIQEIEDTLAFSRFVDGLDGYEGLYSQDDYGSFYQKTGVVYRSDIITVSDVRQLFWWHDSVTRPPLEMVVSASLGGGTFEFKLIVLHFKAGWGDDDRALRAASCRLLKEYLDDELEHGSEREFVVVGDWNDLLDDPPEVNVFAPFLDDTLDYRFLTWPLRGSSRHGSYIGGSSSSLIDHLMVTSAVLDEYEGGTTMTLRLDDEVGQYENVVSDHRPVMACFPVFGSR